MNRIYRIAWFAALAVWTWLLLKPDPFPALARQLSFWGEIYAFCAAKGLHFAMYASFAFSACLLFDRRRRATVIGALFLHGALSELGQFFGNLWFETHRTGTVLDAIIDWVAIGSGLGAYTLFRRFTARRATSNLETSQPGVRTEVPTPPNRSSESSEESPLSIDSPNPR